MAQEYGKDKPEGFSNRIEKVAIVGAGGQVGKHITEHLLKTGKHTVTAITRPNSTSQLPEGVQVARVDYSGDDDSALVDALRGQQVLIITMAVMAPRDTTVKLIRAAAKAKVPYVQPNWFGHDSQNPKLLDESMLSHRSACAEIERLGVSSYLLLNCNFWYEFSLGGGPDRYGFDFHKRSLILFDDGNTVINTSTWPQCGRALASLLSLKELPDDEADKSPTLSRFRNGPVYVSSFRVSQRDMFESVKRVTGTTDADWTITHESSEERWKEGQAVVKQGDFLGGFAKQLYSRMFFPNGDGDFESKRGLHNGLLGLPVEDLDEYTALGVRMGENNEVVVSH
ncbi:NAD(P)-binding protein [Aspergillus steynii IBT 23096]|uniref:NAD(P)-binding protein n=1 Tax=Aspergillus steynii IBT 23096 TaxID=1392250 RepID=A0A2I2G6K9_9EURO|nr:NAD(P)-binding protein [Aspergillus steynii IBT 23096]PLB48511.1 NAD(P)-binding protein [Aspergillus steynii IBT 23096]